MGQLGGYNVGGYSRFEGPQEQSYKKYFPKNNYFDEERFIQCVDAYMTYQEAWDRGRRDEKTKFIEQAKAAVNRFKDPSENIRDEAREEFFNIVTKAAKKFTSYFFGAQTRGSEMIGKWRDAFAKTYPEVVEHVNNPSATQYKL